MSRVKYLKAGLLHSMKIVSHERAPYCAEQRKHCIEQVRLFSQTIAKMLHSSFFSIFIILFQLSSSHNTTLAHVHTSMLYVSQHIAFTHFILMLFTCGKDNGRQGQLKYLHFSCIFCIFCMCFYDELSNVTDVIL